MKEQKRSEAMRAILYPVTAAAVLLIGACATEPEQTSAPTTDATKPGAAKPVETKPIAKVDATQKAAASPFAALKDPNSPLSKRSIYYEYDKFDVKNEYRSLVETHAKFLRDNPSAKMLIQGNTDERGSREYNVGLGQRRSDGVKKMLVLLGAREDQVESVSLGEEKPQDAGHNEDAFSKNRRSDMLYSGEY
jgi:peptidoglycan-associated lipoprotein